MAEPLTPTGPRRAGRAVPTLAGRAIPMSPDDISPEEVARMTGIVDDTERALHSRARENRRRGSPPAVAHHGGATGATDVYHPHVRPHLARIEKLLRQVERTTYQRMSTVFDDWVDLTNIMLDSMAGHLREAVETGRLSAWPADTPPERIASFERVKSRYGAKASEAFTIFRHATGEFLDATHDVWFDWMGQLYMQLELGGRGIGDYYTPWPVAYMMAEIQDISSLLHTRMKEALMHEDNILAAAVGMTGVLSPGPGGEPPILGDEDGGEFFERWVIPAAVPYFDPITVCDPACGSGVMILASAATVPLWARRYGFVQYFGQDISLIAVQMARAQTRAYGLNGFETTMVQAIGDAGWEKFHARQKAGAAIADAPALAQAQTEALHPPLSVIPRVVTGHIAHPTLRLAAAAQAAPTLNLTPPTREELRRLTSRAARPQGRTGKGATR